MVTNARSSARSLKSPFVGSLPIRCLLSGLLLALGSTPSLAASLAPEMAITAVSRVVEDSPPAAQQRQEREREVLVCDGGWRFPLYETRREPGPARLARLAEIQQDLVLSKRAFGYCTRFQKSRGDPPSSATGISSLARGACEGLLAASRGINSVSEHLFGGDAPRGECLGRGARRSGQCEQVREQLTTLRRYQRLGEERAALVASHEVCASQERGANRALRERCESLESSILGESSPANSHPGRFALSAPIPKAVAHAVEAVRQVTDGHYLGLVSEDSLGVRQSVCESSSGGTGTGPWSEGWAKVRHSLCAELAIATSNAQTCRQADLYIDERGQLHRKHPLNTQEQRRKATLCIDVSDFDSDHPLMVTSGIAPTSSVPERVWPGETVMIGHSIDQPARGQDVLQISVFGKARGVSLKEVLRVNGANFASRIGSFANSEACRIARSWVPVVDHEVPVGPEDSQAVIPANFSRGRDGGTAKVSEGEELLVWVREIEPSGAVLVEYAQGQSVRYEPPPLLGKSDPGEIESKRPGQYIRGVGASVSEPLLPRRARYPGSRVLRLGSPAGNSEYQLRICTQNRVSHEQRAGAGQACSTENIIVNERLYVHGASHMGVQLHVGYSYFRTPSLAAKRTAAARAAGGDLYEIVEKADGRASQDIAVLLSVYPFGRDPYDFSHLPWRASFWRHAALLGGFSMKKTSFWEDLYLGGSLPLANGVSATVLAHFTRREVPSTASSGQFLSIPGGANSIDLGDYVAVKRALSVGIGVGISFDLNLFQKAFSSVWGRISGPQSQFYSSGGGR